MRAHGKTHVAPCTHGPASVAPLWRLSVSENPVTSACTVSESIVPLPLPLLLAKKLLSTWAKGSRHEFGPTLSRCAKMLIARNIQDASVSCESQPEAMCNAMHAITSSEYRSGWHSLRAHVSVMYTHAVALSSKFRFDVEERVCGWRAPLRAARREARAMSAEA